MLTKIATIIDYAATIFLFPLIKIYQIFKRPKHQVGDIVMSFNFFNEVVVGTIIDVVNDDIFYYDYIVEWQSGKTKVETEYMVDRYKELLVDYKRVIEYNG